MSEVDSICRTADADPEMIAAIRAELPAVKRLAVEIWGRHDDPAVALNTLISAYVTLGLHTGGAAETAAALVVVAREIDGRVVS